MFLQVQFAGLVLLLSCEDFGTFSNLQNILIEDIV